MGGNSKKTGLLISCWLVLALALVVCFFIAGDNFLANLKPLFEALNKPVPEMVTKAGERRETKKKAKQEKIEKEIEKENLKNTNSDTSKDDPITIVITPGPDEIGSITEVPELINDETAEDIELIPEVEKNEEKISSVKKETENQVAKSKVTLCFVNVDSDGKVVRKTTTREIPKTNAPLTNAVKALLNGPESPDKGCISLIPAGTKLLGASVKNGIATLNFSEEFEFNGISADGYRAQLMQVVYTATEFSTVDSVQFLIEGQRKDYMGSEEFQIWIGSPYSRNSFQ